MCTKLCLAVAGVVTGVILAALGAGLGWGLFPKLVEQGIADQIALVPGSEAWDLWVELPIPLNFKVYLFNVTNPEEVHAGAVPVLNQMGPYIYDEYKKKEVFDVSEDGTRVRYYQYTDYIFNATLSGGAREDDKVTLLNGALMGAALGGDMDDSAAGATFRLAVNRAVPGAFKDSSTVFATNTVREVLFDGVTIYCDGVGVLHPSYLFCQGLKAEVDAGTNTALRPAEDGTGDFLYSYFYYNEVNHDGAYTVNTGVEDPQLLGWIHEWENSSTLPFWGGPECNVIKGTDAAIFPPFLTRESRVDIFSTDLCRSLYAEYLEDMEHKGVKGYRFVASEEQLATAEDNPENYCYCADDSGCLKRGSLDLQACVNGPIVLTFPHFYQSSPDYLAMVEGLSPTQEQHQTFLDIEPTTGVPLGGGKRVQFNMMSKAVPGVDITKNLRPALIPLFWIDEGVELDDENTDLLKSGLKVIDILNGIRWGMLGVGVVLCLAGSCVLAVHYGKQALRNRALRKRAVGEYNYGTKVIEPTPAS